MAPREHKTEAELQDNARGAFLLDLDLAAIEVDDFEASFIETFLKFGGATEYWTAPRRAAVDAMRRKYEGRL